MERRLCLRKQRTILVVTCHLEDPLIWWKRTESFPTVETLAFLTFLRITLSTLPLRCSSRRTVLPFALDQAPQDVPRWTRDKIRPILCRLLLLSLGTPFGRYVEPAIRIKRWYCGCRLPPSPLHRISLYGCRQTESHVRTCKRFISFLRGNLISETT